MAKGMEVGTMSREQCAFKKIMVKNSLHAVKAKPSRKEEVESAVAAENARLRKELDRLQRQLAILQPSEQVLLLI